MAKVFQSLVESTRQEKIRNKFNSMIKYIRICEIIFKASDVCLNGKACTEKFKTPIFGAKKVTTYRVDCKCPLKLNFKCGPNYCTRDLEACHYFENKNFDIKINGCGNDGTSAFKSFSSWSG